LRKPYLVVLNKWIEGLLGRKAEALGEVEVGPCMVHSRR